MRELLAKPSGGIGFCIWALRHMGYAQPIESDPVDEVVLLGGKSILQWTFVIDE